MFLYDKNSVFKDQKNSKPKIEDIADQYVDKKHRNNLHTFIGYLKENMTSRWASVNSWKILYKAKDLAFLKVFESSWYLDPVLDFKDKNFEPYAKKENIEKIILENVEFCINCLPNGQCTPGRSVKIFGKELKNVCHVLRFKDPKTSEIDCIKKIFEYRKNAINEGGVSKTFYVGKSKKDELIKKHGIKNYDFAYEAIMLYINGKKDTKHGSMLGKFDQIKKKNPKISFLKLFEAGLEEM